MVPSGRVDLVEQDRVVGLVEDLPEPLLAVQDPEQVLSPHLLHVLEVEGEGEVVGAVLEQEALGFVERAVRIRLDHEEPVLSAVHADHDDDHGGIADRGLDPEVFSFMVADRVVLPPRRGPVRCRSRARRPAPRRPRPPAKIARDAEEAFVRPRPVHSRDTPLVFGGTGFLSAGIGLGVHRHRCLRRDGLMLP